MDKKGQEINVGVVITLFISIIAGLVLWQAAVGNMHQSTQAQTLSQGLYTTPANGGSIDLVGQELLSTPTVTNRTSGATVAAANYTIAETVSAVDGLKRISYKTNAVHYQNAPVNISYNYGAEGYIDDAGGRSIYLLIPILAALAIALVALVPTLREKFLDMIGK